MFGKAFAIVRIRWQEALAYRAESIIWMLCTNMPLVMLLLWRAVAKEAPVGHLSAQDFTAYFLITLIVRFLTGCWVVWLINFEVRDGSLAVRLLKPLPALWSYALQNWAEWLFRVVIISVFAVAVLFIVGLDRLTHDPRQWAIIPLSVMGAWCIQFFAMLAMGSLALFTQSSMALHEVWLALYFVCSGYLFPLALFPPWAARWVHATPFPSLISFPVENALGMLTYAQSLSGLAAQYLWVAALAALSLTLWHRGIRRFQAYGG